ncbi:alpha/beta fold hydrolase [Actinomadura rudentiformis]|uniref:Alpha/beta fold hydrolase n=1 Tax=Actinomadura rudentiformis TaxID=359158 RepID=A0A6H9YPK1_9ACTN|nr:alpha/beta hydrolase [Actinomadura rudentiformis]KAB2344761.1 alpha/beta fold hydrolase [Actinomadura rudentiformis]
MSLARTVQGSGPGLALAHGAGGGIAANYGPILDALAAEHTVVGVDYPGTGETPRAATPFELDELADELVDAAVAEGLETFAISGYSLGTAVAVRAATRHPERVTALVLTAPFARPDTHFRLAASIWSKLHASGDHTLLAEFLLLLANSPAALDSIPAADLAGVVHATAGSLPPGTPEHTEILPRVDVRADLARISVPTLVISTTRDRLVPPSLHREVAAQITGARLAELDTGHLPFAERPESWAKLITDFIAGAAGRARCAAT